MAKQTFNVGQILTADQMTSLQQTAMGGGSATAKTASYTLVAADAGTVVQMNAAGATTITVNTALFAAGDTVQIQNIGAGVCTITAGTATVNTSTTLALSQYDSGNLYFNSTSAALFFNSDSGDAPTSGSYTVIASGTLSGTSQSTTSIPSTYKKLIAIYDNYYVSGTDTTPQIRINTISSSTYNVQRLNVTNGTSGTARLTSAFSMDEVNAGTSSSNDNQAVLIIDGYASNTFHSYQINSNPTNGNQYVYFGSNTAIGEAVTSIQFQTANGTTSWAGGTYAVYGVN